MTVVQIPILSLLIPIFDFIQLNFMVFYFDENYTDQSKSIDEPIIYQFVVTQKYKNPQNDQKFIFFKTVLSL